MTPESPTAVQTQGLQPATLLSTDSVGVRERGAYWVDLICDVFVQLDCGSVQDGFFGHIADRPLGDVRLSEVVSTTQHVRRSRGTLARATDDCMLISLQTAGRGCIEQDGRQALLEPGDFALYDSTRCYDLRFEDHFTQLVFKAPRAMFLDRVAGAQAVTATRVEGSSGMGRVASRFFQAVAREAHTLLPHEIERVTHNLIDVMATAIGHSLVDRPVSQSSTRAAQLIRIKMYIESHLSDPHLDPQQVACANGISVRYLSKLFEDEGITVCRWIWTQRLEHIGKDLADPAFSGRSISEIALRWGFNNLSHFSRAFRDHFGKCARTFRATH